MTMLEVDKKYVIYSQEQNKLTVFEVYKYKDDLLFDCQEEDLEIRTLKFEDFKSKYDGSVWLGSL